jgi:hypothetical protein
MSEYIVLRVRDDEQERRRCEGNEKRRRADLQRQQYEREMMQRKEALQRPYKQMMQKAQLDIVEQHAGKHEDQLSVYSSYLLWLCNGSLM